MKFNALLLLLPLAMAPAALAAGPSAPPSHMSALEEALTDCAAKVKKDTEGMPDQKAMEACMQGKGFAGPEANPTAPAKKAK